MEIQASMSYAAVQAHVKDALQGTRTQVALTLTPSRHSALGPQAPAGPYVIAHRNATILQGLLRPGSHPANQP